MKIHVGKEGYVAEAIPSLDLPREERTQLRREMKAQAAKVGLLLEWRSGNTLARNKDAAERHAARLKALFKDDPRVDVHVSTYFPMGFS